MSLFVNVHAKKVPNPNAMCFVVGGNKLSSRPFTFKNVEEATFSPLASKLFKFDFIEQIFISDNFITINAREDAQIDWDEYHKEVRRMIKGHLEVGEPVLTNPPKQERSSELTDREKSIKGIIEDQILPATRDDGGEITFDRIEDGMVYVKLAGACVGCPFAPRTIKAGVEVLVQRVYPDISGVTSDDVNWNE